VNARRRGARPDGQAGFTLIELLAVLALAVLAALLVLPAGTSVLARSAVDAAARDLAADLRAQRNRAVERQAVLAVVFRPPEAGWWLEGEDLPRPARLDRVEAEVPPSERAPDGRRAIRFFPDGGSTGGAVVLERGGRQARIAVDWLTGRVAVGG